MALRPIYNVRAVRWIRAHPSCASSLGYPPIPQRCADYPDSDPAEPGFYVGRDELVLLWTACVLHNRDQAPELLDRGTGH
jgi:hypothetical protein